MNDLEFSIALVCGAALVGFLAHRYDVYLQKRILKKKRQQAVEAHKAGAKGYWVPASGKAWNPLKSYPRNLLCFCDSGRKAKDCCLPTLHDTCNAEHAPQLKVLMRRKIEELEGKS